MSDIKELLEQANGVGSNMAEAGKYKNALAKLPAWDELHAISYEVYPDKLIVLTNASKSAISLLYKAYSEQSETGDYNDNFDNYINETTNYFAISGIDMTKTIKIG